MSGWITNGLGLATLPFTGNERFAVDTQLASGANPASEAVPLSMLANYLGPKTAMAAARFFGLPPGATPGTVLTVTGTLYAYPFFISAPTLVKTIGVDTTTGQTAGSAHAGLYLDNGAGYPGNLVAGSDPAALIATSGASSQSNTVNLALNAGWYWLATIFTASGTFPTVASVATSYATALNSMLGSDTVAHLIATSAQASMGVNITGQTFGSLAGINAGVFPASATLIQNADVPMVQLGT